VPSRRLLALPVFLLASALLPGCLGSGGNVASHLVTTPAYEPAGQAKCGVKKSADHPLIVEWPSADRATLEAKAQSGLVAVRYVGCEMEVLHRCKLPGKYAYTSITPKHDSLTIKDADELYANMPVGAAKLEGKLEKTGQLQVSMTIVGRYEADSASFPSDTLGEDCDRATHVVSGMTTGAFELSAGGTASVGGQAGGFGAGVGGKSSSSKETLERDGHEEKCEGASRAGEPPDGCGAVLRLDLVPIEAPKHARPAAAADAVDGDGIAPNLYEQGNLRIAATCAEHRGVLAPGDGLTVVLDGKPEPEKPLKANILTSMGTQMVNNVAVQTLFHEVGSVGFIVPPGPHHLTLRAPDCDPVEADVRVSGTHSTDVTADMDVSSAFLAGPVGVPAGLGLAIGGYYGGIPHSVLYQGQVKTIDGAPTQGGGVFELTYDHRFLTLGMLYAVGGGSYSGTVYNPTPGSGELPGPFPVHGSQLENLVELRVGGRLPLRYVALSAGSGIGGSMWIGTGTVDTSSVPLTSIADAQAPQGVNVLWHVPLWAAIDLKPACDFGVRLTGAYDWQPTGNGGSFLLVGAELLWQPSPACSRTPGVNISP
jgi:hypothetical protein